MVSIFLLPPQHRSGRLATKITELVEAWIESFIEVYFETAVVLLWTCKLGVRPYGCYNLLTRFVNFSNFLCKLAGRLRLEWRELDKGSSSSLVCCRDRECVVRFSTGREEGELLTNILREETFIVYGSVL